MKALAIGVLFALVVVSVPPGFSQTADEGETQQDEEVQAVDIAAIIRLILETLGITPLPKPPVDPPDPPDPGTGANPFEPFAGTAIDLDIERRIGNTNLVAEIQAAIKATARYYGLDDASALAYVEEKYGDRVLISTSAVEALVKELQDNHLWATQMAVDVVNRVVPPGGTTPPTGPIPPPGGTPPPSTPDITTVSYIDHIIGMSGLEEVTFNDASNDAEDYLSTYIGTPSIGPTKIDANLYTFKARPGPGFGDVDPQKLVDLYGGWMEYNFFGSTLEAQLGRAATAGNIRAFSIGMESGPPTGSRSGSAHWKGVFVGHHHVSLDAAGVATPIPADIVVDVGEQAAGKVDLDVRFDASGAGSSLVATFEIDKGDLAAAPDDVVTGAITIRRRGNFRLDALAVDTPTAGVGTMVEGQFYGPAGEEAGGVMVLTDGGGGSSTAVDFKISGAFGAGEQ